MVGSMESRDLVGGQRGEWARRVLYYCVIGAKLSLRACATYARPVLASPVQQQVLHPPPAQLPVDSISYPDSYPTNYDCDDVMIRLCNVMRIVSSTPTPSVCCLRLYAARPVPVSAPEEPLGCQQTRRGQRSLLLAPGHDAAFASPSRSVNE